jgi:hypothetical protein
MRTVWGAAAALVAISAPALAQDADKHQLCAERPGITINECTIEPGHFQIETALADWTRETRGGDRTDTILAGDSLLRVGVADEFEVRLGWTPYGHVRDRQDGTIDNTNGVGDVTIGLKRNLIDAQKHGNVGLSFAVLPFATLPVGREPIGDGTWSAGAQLPIGYRVSKTLKFELTPIVEAAADEDGRGRHALYSAAVGAKVDFSEAVSLQIEAEGLRDDDPDREKRGTQALGALSIGIQPDDKSQFDVGAVVGLDRAAPDIELSVGVTRWF